MNRRVSLIVFAVSSAVALASFFYASVRFEDLVVTVPIVTARTDIPAYSQITVEMLEARELPRELLTEPIYRDAGQVVGLISTITIPQGSLIYQEFAVPAETFRLASDPGLEVLSFPVDPAKAVGGQIMRGQRINIYRIARGSQPAGGMSAHEALLTESAEVELLAVSVLVVDVRSARGEAVSADGERTEDRPLPLSIITVAVDPETAQELIRLMGELRNQYDLWVTLAPIQPDREGR